MYEDADGNAIPGYADFTEITNVVILPPDDCCTKACEADQFNFLLPACPDRQTTTGAMTYAIETDYCESTQTDTISYLLSNGNSAC